MVLGFGLESLVSGSRGAASVSMKAGAMAATVAAEAAESILAAAARSMSRPAVWHEPPLYALVPRGAAVPQWWQRRLPLEQLPFVPPSLAWPEWPAHVGHRPLHACEWPRGVVGQPRGPQG